MVPGAQRGASDHLRVRQAANLWKVKERLWQEFLALTPHDPAFSLVDSMPLPACLFARAYRCKRFRGEAALGKDALLRQTFYGFRVHARVCWPGVITRFSVAPANAHELSVVPELVEDTRGLAVGDRTTTGRPRRRKSWRGPRASRSSRPTTGARSATPLPKGARC